MIALACFLLFVAVCMKIDPLYLHTSFQVFNLLWYSNVNNASLLDEQ